MVWTAATQNSEMTFLSAFMAAIEDNHTIIGEVKIHRPGLPHLMHILEKTGELPTLTTMAA